MITTYKYRIKDSNSRKTLSKMASSVNFVWNYINEIHKKNFEYYKRGDKKGFLSAFTVNNLTSGTSKELGLAAQTIQAIAENYVDNKTTFKKSYLKWRSYKKSLGWIPFKSEAIKIKDNKVIYLKKNIRYIKIVLCLKMPLLNVVILLKILNGRWFVTITFEVLDTIITHPNSTKEAGIDLGLNNVITTSDGNKYSRPNLTSKYAESLAKAQRAHKSKRIIAIHDRIKNERKDYLHKLTTELAKSYR